MADPREVRLSIWMERYEGEQNWTAHVPALEQAKDSPFIPLGQGPTPEAATLSVTEQVEEELTENPGLLDHIQTGPQEVAASTIVIKVPSPNVR